MFGFLNKTQEEIKLKEIKNLGKEFKFRNLTDAELECLWYAKNNCLRKFTEVDKETMRAITSISKLMAKEETTKEDIIIAQNFAIIDALGKLSKLMEEKR